ncbi:MAG: SOS response-associated peptidase [Clostridia bacterium]|nr:SOS response-associated peptidase [Clostridia bacterium]
MNKPPLLIPTSEEHNGIRYYIYRSFFPIIFFISESTRILDVICTVDFLSREETLALLTCFGFIRGMHIGVSRKGAHVTFVQKLITVRIPESLDTPLDSMIQYVKPEDRQEETAMCCRYYIDDKADEFAEYFKQAAASPLKDKMVARLARPLRISGEISPTDMVPVLAWDKKGSIRAFPMVWGFTPEPSRRGRPLVNARVETAAVVPSFRDAWASHRCIIPASYFFEWGPPQSEDNVRLTKAGKARYIIQSKGTSPTWLAGLYHTETVSGLTYPSFTILTRDSAGDMRAIHNRMPVILPSSFMEEWITPQKDPAKLIRYALTDLYVAAG